MNDCLYIQTWLIVYGNNAMNLRTNKWQDTSRNISQPEEWILGNSPHYAGFHCSWCFPPAGIRDKLASAQAEDKPRWGDYPDKMELGYLQSLIKTGQWFDGQFPFIKVDR